VRDNLSYTMTFVNVF